MSWIDDGDYFGPDRREKRRLHVFDRRRLDSAHEPPSLGALLRKLQIWASGVPVEGGDGLLRYRARVQTVAKLAAERSQPGVHACLDELDRALAQACAEGRSDVLNVSYRYLQSALATLE